MKNIILKEAEVFRKKKEDEAANPVPEPEPEIKKPVVNLTEEEEEQKKKMLLMRRFYRNRHATLMKAI